MKLSKWIESRGGPKEVARLLGVTDHCVRTWSRRDGTPKATTMRTIIRISKGKVDYPDMIITRKAIRRC